ncbi:MAG: DUF1932 domain-containing protein, partial [Coriobacteriia bacterium]
LPDYLVSRVAEHGLRRAAEMREVALTLDDVGVRPIMATATAERQDALPRQMADAAVAYPDGDFSWRALADALAARGVVARIVSPLISRGDLRSGADDLPDWVTG